MKTKLGEVFFDSVPAVALALAVVAFALLGIVAYLQGDAIKAGMLVVALTVLVVCLYPAYTQYRRIVNVCYNREHK